MTRMTDNPGRAALYWLGVLMWVFALAAMGGIAYVWHLTAFVDQPGNSGEGGMIWFLLGPAIPLWIAMATGLLYGGWSVFERVAPTALRTSASTIPLVVVAFGLGVLAPGDPVVAAAMEISLAVHAVAFVFTHLAAFRAGRVPWAPVGEA